MLSSSLWLAFFIMSFLEGCHDDAGAAGHDHMDLDDKAHILVGEFDDDNGLDDNGGGNDSDEYDYYDVDGDNDFNLPSFLQQNNNKKLIDPPM